MMLAILATLFASCTKGRTIKDPGNLVPLTADQDPTIPSIVVNGARLHSEAFGDPDSTLVIVLHGGPGGDYRDLLHCKDLAAHGYRVVFYDQRGSGLSQRFPKASYTSLGLGALDMMYDELGGVIAHYRTSPAQKVYLLGHSWGAILATGFTAKHPTAVQGLVVSEPGGLTWEDIKDYTKRSRSFSLWGEELNDMTYIDQFLSGSEDQHEILDYKLAMIAAKNDITGEDNTAPASYWRFGAVINAAMFKIGEDHNPDFTVGLRQFTVPTLFLYSSNNEAYGASWAEKVSAAFNAAELKKIEGTGHDGMISDSQAWAHTTLPAIISYFKSL